MAVILIAILMFGPKRIPQIARQVGKILADLRKTSDEFMRELTREPVDENEADSPTIPEALEENAHDATQEAPPAPEEPQSLTSGQIRDAASKLGIETEGKSDEELRSEMMERIYASPVRDGNQ